MVATATNRPSSSRGNLLTQPGHRSCESEAMALELSGERSALAAQAHGRTVVNLFYEDSTQPKTCSTSTNGFPQLYVDRGAETRAT